MALVKVLITGVTMTKFAPGTQFGGYGIKLDEGAQQVVPAINEPMVDDQGNAVIGEDGQPVIIYGKAEFDGVGDGVAGKAYAYAVDASGAQLGDAASADYATAAPAPAPEPTPEPAPEPTPAPVDESVEIATPTVVSIKL
jgi:hypothetical protein